MVHHHDDSSSITISLTLLELKFSVLGIGIGRDNLGTTALQVFRVTLLSPDTVGP